MLALDFDGVIADALAECGAVTWYAAAAAPPGALPAAVASVPADFMALFAQVRAYSRTMDDFMVTHALYPGTRAVDRAGFEQARRASDPATLSARAAAAEAVRAVWRERQFDDWVGLHQVHPQMAELLRSTEHHVAIVSAKDTASIRSILAHHGLAPYVDDIIGSCHDKRLALREMLVAHPAARSEGLTFVDDSIDNVGDVSNLPIRALWATWGYHGPEDAMLAAEFDTQTISLQDLQQLARTPRRTSSPA